MHEWDRVVLFWRESREGCCALSWPLKAELVRFGLLSFATAHMSPQSWWLGLRLPLTAWLKRRGHGRGRLFRGHVHSHSWQISWKASRNRLVHAPVISFRLYTHLYQCYFWKGTCSTDLLRTESRFLKALKETKTKMPWLPLWLPLWGVSFQLMSCVPLEIVPSFRD